MSLIGGSVARAAIHALMPQYVRMGFSARESLKAAQSLGYTMRWQDFLSLRRDVGNLERARPYFAAVGRYARPGASQIADMDMGGAPKYRIWGKSTVYNPDTGKYTTKNVSLYDDYLKSKDEYEADFIDQFGDRMEESGFVFVGMTFTDMAKNSKKL